MPTPERQYPVFNRPRKHLTALGLAPAEYPWDALPAEVQEQLRSWPCWRGRNEPLPSDAYMRRMTYSWSDRDQQWGARANGLLADVFSI